METSIHPTAIISKHAVLEENVSIGPYSIIHDNVHLGSGGIVGPYCILGEPLANFYQDEVYENPTLDIGCDAVIRSQTILYAGSQLGDHLETGNRAIIREKSSIGHHVRIGMHAEIQGFCTIGNYTRINSAVHVGQFSMIGNFVWLFPFVVLTNDPHPPSEAVEGVKISDYAVIGAKSVLLPGIHIDSHALVGAGSVVYHDVPAGSVVAGNPARRIATIDQLKDRITGESTYPWPEHFSRGMPWQEVGFKAWIAGDSERKE